MPLDHAALRRHHLFAHLDEERFARLCHATRPLPVSAGEVIFNAGDNARFFYFVAQGHIQLYRASEQGDEKVIELVRREQTFAEAIMFLQQRRYPVSARALCDGVLYPIAMADFRALLEESSALCLQLLGSISQRLHRAIGDIERLSLQNARMRVVHLLLEAAPGAGTGAGGYQVTWNVPKQVLASRISVRPETFSRVLQELSRAGLIEVDGRHITVPDREALQRAG